jgi:toxin ParE1/3/4
MSVFFSVQAEADLEGIADYIAADSPARALSFVSEIRKHCNKIERAPRAYRLRPELGSAIRGCTHGNYVILFATIDGDVLIVRVLHGARDLRSALSDESPEGEDPFT